MDTLVERDRCPICGKQVEEVQQLNRCDGCGRLIPAEELITKDDDCAWGM